MVESSNVRLTKREVFGTDSIAQGGRSRTDDIEEFGLCLFVANIDAIGMRVNDGVSCSIRSYPNAACGGCQYVVTDITSGEWVTYIQPFYT